MTGWLQLGFFRRYLSVVSRLELILLLGDCDLTLLTLFAKELHKCNVSAVSALSAFLKNNTINVINGV